MTWGTDARPIGQAEGPTNVDLDRELLSSLLEPHPHVARLSKPEAAMAPASSKGLGHEPARVAKPRCQPRRFIEEGPGIENLKHLRMREADRNTPLNAQLAQDAG